MSAYIDDAVAADGELVLPEPVGKQVEWLDSPAPRKVLRVGRRGSKTRFAFSAAVAGHGPGWEENTPLFPGILQGGDVIWIAQDYPNLTRVVWREEVKPRFGHLPWAQLNERDHALTLPGLGTLFLVSSEAINGIRGMGKNVRGIIVDEAAWLALRAALQEVILAILLDNDGWLIIMSTTNAGSDGGYDDTGAAQIPSYFNVICEEIRAGKRSKEWVEFTGTAYDNPTLSPAGIDALISEYAPDSPKLRQEVFAELLKAGIGLALPKLTADRHLCPRFAIPRNWTQWGAFDWGYNHPWVYGWYACDEDGNVYKIDTLWGREQLPEQICATILSSVPATRFVTHAGHDIWQKKGQASGYQGPTIAEVMHHHGIKLVQANTARVLGLDNIRRYTDWQDDWPTEGKDARYPRFRLLETDGNKRCFAQLQAMQIDPDNLEDALKVDADSAGRGGDDGYDETRYGLMARPLAAKAVPPEQQDGVSLGYDYEKHRPRDRESGEQLMTRILERSRPSVTAGRMRVPVRRGP